MDEVRHIQDTATQGTIDGTIADSAPTPRAQGEKPHAEAYPELAEGICVGEGGQVTALSTAATAISVAVSITQQVEPKWK